MTRILTTLLLLFTVQANAATKSELEAEVASLNKRVSSLEQRLESLLEQLETGAGKAEKKKTGNGGPSLQVGGRVKVDMIANSASVGGAGGRNRADGNFNPRNIPLDDTGEEDQYTSHARDSRIWLNASTPTPAGDLGAYIEMDFGSSDNSATERVSNSHNPRVRHAYATFRGFTVGQTYSSFLNTLAYPEMNDTLGPVGILNIRQPLVRYTQDEGNWQWTLSLESPETTVLDRNGASLAFDDDRVPDLVARVDWQGNRGNLSVAALARQLRVDDATAEDTFGYGLSVSGRLFTTAADNLRFSLTYGEGIGRYVSFNGFDDVYMDAAGELDAIAVAGGFLSYQHWWSENWRSNIVAGFAEADIDAGLIDAPVNERYLSSHINLLWSPIPSATFGVEWLYGKRELTDGSTGQLNRIQFTSLYKFKH